MSYNNEWKVWHATNGGSVYIVARSAQQAKELNSKFWDFDRSFKMVPSREIIKVTRNPYKIDALSKLSMPAKSWASRFVDCPWNFDTKPWVILDTYLASHMCLRVGKDKEDKDIKIGVKRSCPCDQKFECVLCEGEGIIVRWITASQKDSGLSLSAADLDAEFAVLDAYKVLIKAGYKIVSCEG